jgi:hypothetical protein
MSTGGGVLAGNLTDLPPQTLTHMHDGLGHSYAVGEPGVLDNTTMHLYSWASPLSPQLIHSPSDNGLAPYEQVFNGDALFWRASSVALQRIKVRTSDGTISDLVSFGADTSQGAADFGTDGQAMVWLAGTGRSDPYGLFPTVSVMTSSYSTDPSQIKPRRLRSETPNGFGTSPFVVGCGYSARSSWQGVRVIRLADGVSWLLPRDANLTWDWVNPLVLTCTELFATVSLGKGQPNVARVKLNSLGSGTAPD